MRWIRLRNTNEKLQAAEKFESDLIFAAGYNNKRIGYDNNEVYSSRYDSKSYNSGKLYDKSYNHGKGRRGRSSHRSSGRDRTNNNRKDKRDRDYNSRSSNNKNDDYHNEDRNRSRSRDRSSNTHNNNMQRIRVDFPDPEEEGSSTTPSRREQIQLKQQQYVKKNGKLYGSSALKDKICWFYQQKRCTYGDRCKRHHICGICWVVGEHVTQDCPHKRDIQV